METSAAVPSRTELVERGLAELADDDIEHLADVMVRAWVRVNRLSLAMVALPFGGCTGIVAVGGEAWFGVGLAFGAVSLLLGVFVQAIAGALSRRSIALEVESLGYRAAVGREAGAAWLRALRSFLPRITRAQKRRACVKALVRARDRAARSG